MKQDKSKIQDETHIEQDELLFDSQAIKEAEQVVPIAEDRTARNSDETNYPRVAIEGFRRKFSPLSTGLIAIFSIGLIVLIGMLIYKNSAVSAENQDINDEVIIPKTGGASADNLSNPVQSAASSSAIVAESKKQPTALPKTAPKKPVSTYIKPENQYYPIIRDNNFERDRIYNEDKFRDRIFNDRKLERKIRKARKRYDREREFKRERRKERRSGKRNGDD